jgi:hypothetical protein
MPLIYSRHDPRHFDARLHKSDGSGEMRQQEDDRQKKVQAAVDTINAKFGIGSGGPAPAREQFTKHTPGGVRYEQMGGGADAGLTQIIEPEKTEFDEAGYNAELQKYQQGGDAKAQREAMYGDIAGAVRDTAMRDLDRQFSEVSQKNLFGLARHGMLGSSVDAETGGDLATRYGEGKLKAQQMGMQSASDLRVQDEKTRQNLISLAQSGLDTGTAASLAQGQLASAADLARSQTAQATVGRLFDDLPQAYMQQQVMRARYPQAGMQQMQPAGYGTSVFAPKGYTGKLQS